MNLQKDYCKSSLVVIQYKRGLKTLPRKLTAVPQLKLGLLSPMVQMYQAEDGVISIVSCIQPRHPCKLYSWSNKFLILGTTLIIAHLPFAELTVQWQMKCVLITVLAKVPFMLVRSMEKNVTVEPMLLLRIVWALPSVACLALVIPPKLVVTLQSCRYIQRTSLPLQVRKSNPSLPCPAHPQPSLPLLPAPQEAMSLQLPPRPAVLSLLVLAPQ